MKQIVSVAAVLAAFALSPALAEQLKADDAQRARAVTTEAETKQQQGAANPDIQDDLKQKVIGQPANMEHSLDQFAQDTIAAMQIGNLATDKHTPAAVALLGDRMSLTHGRINQALDALATKEKAEMPQRMSDEGLASMKSMTDLNQEAFAGEFVGWVGHTYPRMISTLESWSKNGDETRKQLAETFLPELRNQLQAAQHLTQAGFDSQQAMDMLERKDLPIERKDGAGIAPPGPATEGPDQPQSR